MFLSSCHDSAPHRAFGPPSAWWFPANPRSRDWKTRRDSVSAPCTLGNDHPFAPERGRPATVRFAKSRSCLFRGHLKGRRVSQYQSSRIAAVDDAVVDFLTGCVRLRDSGGTHFGLNALVHLTPILPRAEPHRRS